MTSPAFPGWSIAKTEAVLRFWLTQLSYERFEGAEGYRKGPEPSNAGAGDQRGSGLPSNLPSTVWP